MDVNTVAKCLSAPKCFMENDQEGHDSLAQAQSSGKINKSSNPGSSKDIFCVLGRYGGFH